MRDLLEVIWQRHSCRSAFDPSRPVPHSQIEKLLDAARWAPTAHNLQNYEIIVVDDQGLLDALTALSLPPSEAFMHEHHRPLSLTEAELAARGTGLSAGMFPASWLEQDEAAPPGQPLQAYMGRQMPACATLLVIVYDPASKDSAAQSDTLEAMGLGCVLQNIWLTAEYCGICVQVLSAFGDPATAEQVRSILHIPATMRIACGMRLGYLHKPAERYLRVRRRLRDFAHANYYGHSRHPPQV